MPDARIITFYSYKGGTGRSMSLANTAWILASNGLRVLVVDWDLEAPGLHRYLHPFLPDPGLRSSLGVIDLIWEFANAAVDPQAPNEPGWHEEYARISPYTMSINHDFPNGGTIDLLPAGRQDAAYATLVSSFDWDNFYDRLGGGGFVEAIKRDMRERYDYVLVDSRTGLSDTAGICTVQLPDLLVVCFSMSTQAIEGTAAAAASAERQRMGSDLRILPVPMRVEDGEQEKLEASRDYARSRFDRFLWHVDKPELYWGDVEIPYRAYYAYEEILATIADRPHQRNSVLAATERLIGYLTGGQVTELAPMASEAQRRELLSRFQRTGTIGTIREPLGLLAPRVFISYTHDSSGDVEQVRQLWALLRTAGVDARLDQGEAPHRQDWAAWVTQAAAAHLVVLIEPAGPQQDTVEPWPPYAMWPKAQFEQYVSVTLPTASLPRGHLPAHISGHLSVHLDLTDLSASGIAPLVQLANDRAQQAHDTERHRPAEPPYGGIRSKLAAGLSALSPGTAKTARERRRRWIRLCLLGLVMSVFVAAGWVVIQNWGVKCAAGVEHRGDSGECIGLTDGSYIFDEQYRDIENKILAENSFVQQQALENNKLYVTIAWFEPMTLNEPDTTTTVEVRHRLQSAYLAQHRANHPPRGQRPDLPLIKLLLANPGSVARHWEPVVNQIKDRQESDNLVAVAGLGQSLDGTRHAVNRLAGYKIPVVAGLVTANSMSASPGEKEPELVRVVPTNTDQVRALLHNAKPEVNTALLVKDTNPVEVFPQDIGDAFQTTLAADNRGMMIERFSSAHGRTVNDFPGIVSKVCQEKPDVVFFAGRRGTFTEFLDALASRSCQSQTVRALTGDNASGLAQDEHVTKAVATGVIVQFTNLVDQDAGKDGDSRINESTRYFREAGGPGYHLSDFRDDSLEDGQAITSHDALWTAVFAARRVVALTKDDRKPPAPEAVAAEFGHLHGDLAVAGASGWISLDGTGKPQDKALTIVQVGPGPTVTRTVSSASGTPCTPNIPPC